MSEELENSLQQAIESYLGDRLRAIDDQLSRLQAEFTETLARLRQSSAGGSLDATPVSAAIAAHMLAAREQKLSGAISERASASAGVAVIKRAVVELEKQQSQANVLGVLLTSAAQFAERAALFVIKNDQAIGWRVCEATDPTNLDAIPSIVLPLTSDTIVGRAARSRSAEAGAPASGSEDSLLADQLSGEPQNIAAVPLIVRERVVAVLYADSASPEAGAVDLDALETLVRVAGMAVDIISSARVAPSQEVGAAPPAPVESAAVPREETPELSYTPQVELQTPGVFVEPEVEEVYAEPATEIAPEEPAESVVEEVYAEPATEIVAEEAVEPAAEEVYAGTGTETAVEETESQDVQVEPAVERGWEATPAQEPEAEATTMEAAPQPFAPPAEPSFASQYAAPLGGTRRYGIAEPELPIEVGEEERRLHNDARRFARLLVSEIKLYNEPKVKEGRSKSDIYDRLRDDIDRSRQMYEKRVAPPVAARHDYFHQELVNTLAEGDPAKLGSSYPGASVSAN